MTIRRGWILFGSVSLQVASWFDITALLNQIPWHRPMNSLQTAQLVASGVLALIFLSIRPANDAS